MPCDWLTSKHLAFYLTRVLWGGWLNLSRYLKKKPEYAAFCSFSFCMEHFVLLVCFRLDRCFLDPKRLLKEIFKLPLLGIQYPFNKQTPIWFRGCPPVEQYFAQTHLRQGHHVYQQTFVFMLLSWLFSPRHQEVGWLISKVRLKHCGIWMNVSNTDLTVATE